MGFKIKEFTKAKFEARTAKVQVPILADFFNEGDKPEFTVRGLTGEEQARVNEVKANNKNISAAVTAIASRLQKEKVEGFKDLLGVSDDVPTDLACRIEMLVIACIDPEMDVQTASKLFEVAHVDGYNLTNKILILSGQGMAVGKPKASGKTKASKAPSTSDTPEAK